MQGSCFELITSQYISFSRKVKIPICEGQIDEDDERELMTRASTRMTRVTLHLPQTSVAGVKGAEAELFDEYQDKRSKVIPKSHVWTPTGDLLVGCAGGQILRVNVSHFFSDLKLLSLR